MNKKTNKLVHVAFIMDGNGRWAKNRNLPRHLGHKAGCDRVSDIYEECLAQGIKVISLFAFSTENWSRPKAEINHLFKYLEIFFKKEIERMDKNGTKIVTSGDLSLLPSKTQEVIEKAKNVTKNNNKTIFNICLNYGGRQEIVRACKLFAQDVINHTRNIDDLNIDNFNDYLYTKELPPVDLLIRTSGEERTSNFLPYQLAYAEFIFPKTYWPDFTKEEFRKCLNEYYSRDRRYGGIHEKETTSD